MRLGIISDIHANEDALVAVLRDLSGVDEIVCCGDLVEYYDRPNEVCAIVRERGIRCIRGNHDAYTLGALPFPERYRAQFRTDWTREVLEETHLEWLRGLGTQLHIEGPEHELWIRHASPWDEETYLRAGNAAVLDRIALNRGQTLVVGHTHRPMYMRRGEGWLLNPGSVGQPRDGDSRAAYAIVDLETGAATQHRVSYDVAAVQRRLERQDWDPDIVRILSR
jgi:predicted phosphodiesterase